MSSRQPQEPNGFIPGVLIVLVVLCVSGALANWFTRTGETCRVCRCEPYEQQNDVSNQRIGWPRAV